MITRMITLIFFIGIGRSFLWSQPLYQDYFTESALRMDFFQVGDRQQVRVILDELFREESWAGNPGQLLDTMNLGHFLVKVSDRRTGQLIYSCGFSTLFEEWQTTAEALSGKSRVMGGTLRMPFPRDTIRVEIYSRDEQNLFSRRVGDWTIDPASPEIRREKRAVDATVFTLAENGPSAQQVDLLLIGEGYSGNEKEKFRKDAEKLTGYLFAVAPFSSHQSDFNVRAVFSPSADSGIDDPVKGVYKRTPLNFSLNTFGSHRYAMSFDSKSLSDLTSVAPCDVQVILLNTDHYGGGGVFNLYASVAVSNRWAENILVHEFGHAFAGLGDEYYTSDIAYHDYYSTIAEPWEPNLTLLTDPLNVKWKSLLTPGLPVPTPWEQNKYDAENADYQRKITELRQRGGTNQQQNKVITAHNEAVTHFFRTHRHQGKVGAFEGAGYTSRGIYRPALECIMFSNRTLKFDPVCADAIRKRIIFFTR